MSVSVVYLCPKCGTPAVHVPTLVGGVAQCRACSWSGLDSELLGLPVEGTEADGEKVRRQFHKDYLAVFKDRGFLTRMAALLEKYGFVKRNGKGQLTGEDLQRYVKPAAAAMIRSFVETRLEEEKKRAGE